MFNSDIHDYVMLYKVFRNCKLLIELYPKHLYFVGMECIFISILSFILQAICVHCKALRYNKRNK